MEARTKTALVTGGAGGIGTAVVRALANRGYRVAVHYRSSRGAAERLADEVGGVALAADLRDEGAVTDLFDRAVATLGSVQVCVANAGVWPEADLPLWELPPERWRSTLDSNLTATFLTARAFLAHAATTGTGSLVLIGSTAGRFGEAGHADYAAAKGAIQTGLLLSAKNEAARIGNEVRVNAVAPGWVATPMSADALEDEARVARALSTMSLKKVATPEDIAAAVCFLASEEDSGHLSGELLTVAGGMEGRQVP